MPWLVNKKGRHASCRVHQLVGADLFDSLPMSHASFSHPSRAPTHSCRFTMKYLSLLGITNVRPQSVWAAGDYDKLAHTHIVYDRNGFPSADTSELNSLATQLPTYFPRAVTRKA